MTQRRRFGGSGLGLALLALVAVPTTGSAQYVESPSPAAYALENVTVVHADGRQEAGVTLVIRRGLIQAMGPGVVVPPDATVLEGDSLRVYPGLVDAQGTADLDWPSPEAAGAPSWDLPRDAQGFTPHRLVAHFLSGTGADHRAQRNAGIVAAGIHPGRGMAPGQSATVLFKRTAETPWDLVMEPRAGLFLSFQGASGGYPSSLFAVMAHFRQMFEDAARYSLIQNEYRADPRGLTHPRWDPDFEILTEAASGQIPVFFRADEDEDIRRILSLSDEIGFRPMIVGGEEAWQLADDLAARGIPVLVSVAFPSPREWEPPEEGEEAEGMEAGPAREEALEPGAAREKERLENAYANPSRLLAAGVEVALTSGGGEGDLLEGVRKTMEYGLSEGDALTAVTETPASLLGVSNVVHVEPGMAANLVVTDGPLFEEGTLVRFTFVEGELEKGREARPAGGGEAPSVDLSGSWDLTINAQGMEMSFTMTLSQDGAAFSGSMTGGEMGDARIEEGMVSGSSLSFNIVFSMGAESMEIPCTASVTGDRLHGSGNSDMGAMEFTATRRPGTEGGIR